MHECIDLPPRLTPDLLAQRVVARDAVMVVELVRPVGTINSVLTWEGSTLVITSAISSSGQNLHQVERWSLDSARTTLTAERTVEAMGQPFATTLVLLKRP